MKLAIFFIALACVILKVSAYWTAGHSGQSACTDPKEHYQRFQHNLDPTKYWYCETEGAAATLQTCEHGTAYIQALRNCIPWGYWQWTAPADPPTLA